MQSYCGSAIGLAAVPRVVAATIAVLVLVPAMVPLHGQRAQVASKVQQTLKGEVQLSESRAVTAQRIVLDDLRLVTNGHRLELNAEVLEVRGSGRIRAFEGGVQDRKPGEPGRSAGLILLNARRVLGPAVQIDNSGEDGMDGRPGAPGKAGANGNPGTPRDWKPWTGCLGGKDGDEGGPGGRGGEGGPGGPGGNGGVVLLDLAAGGEALAAKAVSKGGRGGKGGDAGQGGPGGAGGAGAAGASVCGGTAVGKKGADGPPGERGKDGVDGAPGQVIDVSKRKSQRPMPTGMN
jgi:hypothetical protein